jgi:hypothetical protein
LETAGILWEGAEELSQQGLENYLIGKAIAEQKERTPDFDETAPPILEEGARSFALGAVVSGVVRLPGHAFTASRKALLEKKITEDTGATKAEAKIAVEAMQAGGPVQEEAKQVITEQVKQRRAEAESKTAQAIDKLVPRQKDLLGRPTLEGGAAGAQAEMLDKEKFKTLAERERIVAEQDLEGQMVMPRGEAGAKEFIALVESHKQPTGGLDRGLDYFTAQAEKLSNEELADVLKWARTQSPYIKRFLGGDIAAILRGRGEPVDVIGGPYDTLAPIIGAEERAVIETGMTNTQRTKHLRNIEKQITEHPIYQNILEAEQTEQAKFEVGTYFIPEVFRGEAKDAIANHPALKFHITYDPKKGKHWDEGAAELLGQHRLEGAATEHIDISEFLERLGQAVEAKKKTRGLVEPILEGALEEADPEVQILADIRYGLQSGKSVQEINANTREWAEHYDLTEDDISDILLAELSDEQIKAEREKAKTEDEALEKLEAERLREKEAKTRAEQERLKAIIAKQEAAAAEKTTREKKLGSLRQRIHAVAAKKGLTKERADQESPYRTQE